MKIKPTDFQVRRGQKVSLDRRPTAIAPLYPDKDAYKDLLEANAKELDGLQRLLYSSGQYALLLIFQGMDASGKDGIIRSVMNRVDPQGCMVYSFKKPSPEEWKHDFLWRTHMRLPERGKIGIFNRAYYEDVLVPRVKPEILRNQGIDPARADKVFWQGRFRTIVESEAHLFREGKKNARLIVSALIIEALRNLKMKWPVATPERLKELKGYRKSLL